MGIRKTKFISCRKIAALVVLSMCLQILAPAGDVFAAYTSTETETHNKASQKLGSYSTSGYVVTATDRYGNEVEIPVPVNKVTETVGDKVLTTNSLDMDYLQDYAKENKIDLGQFVEDGQYKIPAEIQYDVVIDNKGNTVSVVGQDAMLAAPEMWGGSWSQKTKNNITDEDSSICEGTYYYPAPADPTATPRPTEGPSPVVVTNTPIPTNAPTTVPITDAPATPIPTPVATATPKPSVSPTPAPTPAPQTYTYYSAYEYTKYYSSTNGHSVSDITVNGKIADDTGVSVISLADALANVGTRKAYDIAKDAKGNEWYFIKSDSSYRHSTLGNGRVAYSVHPKTYNGYDVESSEVRFISELVFPDYVTIGSTKYFVRSIGGSGPYYYEEPASAPSGTVSSDIGQIKGEYSWKSGSNKCGFTYQLGVVGNGSITSYGFRSNTVRDYDYYVYETSYKHNYHVYNTTLTSITIPDCCIKIEDYAFHNCQALLIINNCKVTTIGTHAFSVSEVPKLQRSQIYSSEYGTTRRIFSYDDSYVSDYKSDFTSTMYEFQRIVEIGPHMEFPSLSALVTIGESAFENRSHLKKVGLYSTVKTIHQNAFKNCTLDQISVPSTSAVVNGNQDTLGTKGKDVLLKTIIVTPRTSLACQYGQKYDDYYRLMQEAYINYRPNGGTPIATQTEMAEVKYIDANYTDEFYVSEWQSSSGEAVYRAALWRGEDGMIYSAQVSGTKIQGGPVENLKNYRFSSLVPFEDSSHYLATMTNGATYLIKVNTSSYKPSYSLYRWNVPAEYVSLVAEKKGLYELYKITGTDGRYHWWYNGTCISEPEWPGEVVQVVYSTETVRFTDYVFIETSYHKAVLCTDGSVYYRTSRDAEWVNIPGSYVGIYESYNGRVHACAEKDALYYSVTTFYTSDGEVVIVDSQGRIQKTVVTFAGALQMEETVSSEEIALDSATLYYYSDTYGSGTNASVYIKKESGTKQNRMYCTASPGYGYGYGSDAVDYSVNLGTGDLLAVRVSTGFDYFSYYLSESGYLCRSTNFTPRSGTVTGTRFQKAVVLNSFLAPIGLWSGNSSYTCTTPGCQGHKHYSSIESVGTDGISGSGGGKATVCIAALDMEGHLWYGVFYLNAAGNLVESLTRCDDRIYTDILSEQISSSSDSYQSSDNGESYISSQSETTTTNFFALDSNKDVYSFKFKAYEGGGSTNGISTETSHKSDGGSSGRHYAVKNFTLTDMNYADDVERFVAYPFLMFTTEEPGLLTTNKCTLDIFCGVEVVYDISKNKWFEKEGYDFTHWNTSADDTGTAYMAGTEIRKTIYSTSWTSSAADLTLYAQWETAKPKPKYVYYDANGGYGTMDTTVIPAGSSSFVVAGNGFTRTGHTFAGYFTEHADGTGTKYYPGRTMTTDKNSVILYAQWIPNTYTVEFAYDDFRVVPPYIFDRVTLAFTRSIAMPPEPYKKLCIVDYDLNTNSSMSTAASAKWTTPRPFTEEYTTARLKFLGWDKYYFRNNTYIKANERFEEWEEVSGLSKVKDDVVTMFPVWGGIDGHVCLPGAVCNGYELYGWMDARKYEDATDIADYVYENGGGLYVPKASETLYAWWVPLEYEVKLVSTFEGNPPDTTGDTSVTMTFDAECPEVVAPTLEHYVFAGYYTEPDGKGEKYYGRADSTTGKAGAYEGKLWQIYDGSVDTLYAYWLPDKAIQYEANYTPVSPDNDADEYTTWTEYIVTEEMHWTLAEKRFTRTGYHFTGWNTKADGSGTSYRDKETIDISWINGTVPLYAMWEPNEYTVQFAPDSIGEDPVIPPPGPDDIWTYEEEYTIPGQPYVKHDKVTYDLNRDDKSTEPYMVTDLTDEHTKSIYRFIGWQLYEKTASGYVKLDSLFTVGQVVKNLTVEEGKAFVLFPVWEEVPDGVTLPLAACVGYMFHGWTEICTKDSMADSSDILTAGATYITDGDTTLYAYWTPKEYDVILDDRGATSTGHTESVHMVFDEVGPDIIVPEKTGYTFQGYFTGIRGAGTKYYDETGTCIKPWTEDNVYVLFACWAQEEVKLPEVGDRTPPEELPEGDMEGNVGRTDAKGLLYADDYNSATDALTDLQPYLAYDTPGSEGAVPGTEKLAFRAKMGSWMLSYKFHRSSGTDDVRIYVAVPYRTQYEESETEKLVISPVQTKTYEVVVPKAWSYWEVLESGMYYPDKVDVTNAALKDGSITVEVDREGNSAVAVPSYAVTKYGDKEEHVFWDDYDADGTPVLYIILEEIQYIISNVPDTLPNIDRHLKIICENAAWEDNRQASVRSDKYEFGGEIILSDELNTDGNGSGLQEEKLPDEESAVEFTSYLQTYESGIELDEYKPNGAYGTTAVITYAGDEANIGTAATKKVVLSDINAVRIHTPVACEGVAVDGIEDGVITLKNALNFFTLRIDNAGTHRMSLGYGTKDFSFALSGKSNVAEKNGSYLNQVKFPFDVYVDVGNNSLKADGTYDTTGDYYFAAGTWFTMGMEEQRFYIPITQKNGSFVVEFRTIAVNCPKSADGNYQLAGTIKEHVNIDKTKYVVTDSMEIAVRSYLKDFIITDTNDPAALRELKAGNQALTLKKGYEFSYQVVTQGEFYGENSEIEIVPSYFWVSEDGAKRQEVTLYRMRELPEKNWKECYAWENEPLLKQHENWDVILQRWGGSGGVPSDVLCVVSDTKQGYCAVCKKRCYVTGNAGVCEICQTPLQNMQPFSLEEYVSKQTITGKEDFFKRSGYLVIQFKIRVKSEENVWYMFERWYDTKVAKDALAAGWKYVSGDVIRYDLSKSIADDYEVGGME